MWYTGPVALVVGALASNFITTLWSVAAVGCTLGAAVLAVVLVLLPQRMARELLFGLAPGLAATILGVLLAAGTGLYSLHLNSSSSASVAAVHASGGQLPVAGVWICRA